MSHLLHIARVADWRADTRDANKVKAHLKGERLDALAPGQTRCVRCLTRGLFRGQRHGVIRLAFILCAVLIFTTGCEPDPLPHCEEAYAHLVKLAKRPADLEQRARFMDACKEAWDPGRHACIMKATTPTQAKQCRPTKVRPG